MLKRLSLYGFKTFAKKRDIDFSDGITCIVGPNGSGKSNIADAIRWILGEQGMKTLRSDKLTEIIFAGSESNKPLNFAEVVILLENSSERFPLNYTEIEITRRIYRDNKSEFLINRNPCRLKDIQEIFLDTGLGKGGISMIGQGQIEKIISSDESERRTLFEEAAGINKYQYRKQLAMKKLELTENNLLRLSDIMQEVESRLAPLKKELNRLNRFKRYKERVDELERHLLFQEYLSLSRREEEAIRHLNTAIEDVDKIELELICARDAYDTEVLSLNELQKTSVEQEKNIYSLKVEMEQTRVRCDSYLLRKKEIEDRLSGTVQLMKSLELQREKLLTDKYGDEDRLVSLRRKVETLSEEIRKTEAEHKNDMYLLDSFRKDYVTSKEQLMTCVQHISTKTRDLNNMYSSYKEIKNELFRLREIIDVVKKDIKEYNLLKEETQKQIEEISLNKTAIEKDMALMKEEKINLNTSLEGIKIDLAGLFKSFSKKEIRFNFLKDLEKSFEGYFPGVRSLMTAKKKRKELAGLIGVVGSLIKVPEKYEKAIEIALGSHIQDIVTKTDTDARIAVEYLRENQKGRATFLPLNIIKPSFFNISGEGRWDKCWQVLGQANKLIDYEPIYMDIINYLLAHYYIVTDLTSGIEILKTYNISATLVTLQGDIIRPAGAITGGSLDNKKESLLSRSRELVELEGEIIEIKKQKEALENKEKLLSIQIASLERNFKEKFEKKFSLESSCIELVRKRDRLILQENQAGERLQDYENILRLNTEKSGNLDRDILKIQLEIQSLREKESVLEIEKKEIDSRLILQENKENRSLEILTKLKIDYATSYESILNLEKFISSRKEQLKQIEDNYLLCSDDARDLEKQLSHIIREEKEDITKVVFLDKAYHEALNTFHGFKDREIGKEKEINAKSIEISSKKEELIEKEKVMKELHIVHARINTEKELLAVKLPEGISSVEEFIEPEKISEEINLLNSRMESMGFINYNASVEYDELDKRYRFLLEQKSDMEDAIFSLHKVIEDLDRTSRKRFRDTFEMVAEEFSIMFRTLFPGGRAYLSLTDEENVLKSGIEIIVHPPGKNLQSISLLSGGEKTMAAVILLLSIFKIKPAPFCVFDEVDAALDDSNTAILADCVKEFSRYSQFIIITHNKITMEKADVLYGITMEEPGISHIISLKLGDPVLDEFVGSEK
ncbi:MAG: Chromosome partition protein Smc [bacterium ADurb.Bin363]|nr:MAG: Chromosome partition protein Smc [bacterium ADurb.Bin363]